MTHFKALTDPRAERARSCSLEEILLLTISAVVSNAFDRTAIADFGATNPEWLRKYLPYAKDTCSHEVPGKVFGAIDPGAFERCFTDQVSHMLGLEGCPATIDAIGCHRELACKIGGKDAAMCLPSRATSRSSWNRCRRCSA